MTHRVMAVERETRCCFLKLLVNVRYRRRFKLLVMTSNACDKLGSYLTLNSFCESARSTHVSLFLLVFLSCSRAPLVFHQLNSRGIHSLRDGALFWQKMLLAFRDNSTKEAVLEQALPDLLSRWSKQFIQAKQALETSPGGLLDRQT